ncbi:uncharacterized protein BO80DRAFT_415003 [Aspergillus ibericus CBS 121593]|uniref:BTB domain-containing protein n=1 Tax=Aspergillus ibericus CBS 121593 TaxID=1448316 RepID=A0A395GPR8_9EURO|nr:hypothetical protein BO80DRAFT_415003 [Aspergillus ibericus CBS 121593]RAK97346.1 hypothetical protein BO80DRAFT_415003 [Aspergillus ibericus CBS 121593]
MKKDKKKKSKQTVMTDELELPPPSPMPSVNEYHQPPTSPYSTAIVQVIIGGNVYGVPEYYLRPYPRLNPSYSWHRPSLDDINPDIGHTLIHFLYTGTYQTIAPSTNDPYCNPRSREFECSVYAYQAARRYEITGLEDIAREYMCTFDDSVTTLEILNIARKVYTTLPSEDAWFETFVRDKLVSAFELDALQFRKDVAQYGVGTDVKFDQFLVAAVMEIYSQRIATLEDAVNSKVEDDHVEEVHEVAVEVPEAVPVEEPYEEPPPVSPVPFSPVPFSPVLDQPYQPPASSFSSPRPVREQSPGYEPLEPTSEPEPEPEPAPIYKADLPPEPEPVYDAEPEPQAEALHEPEPEFGYEADPEPEPEIEPPEIPDSPLYSNWHTLSSKDRKKREKMLVKKGLPIPGKDFELALPEAEPPMEPEPVLEIPEEAEPELPPTYEPEEAQEPVLEPQPQPQEDDGWF